MICVDTCVWSKFLAGEATTEVLKLKKMLEQGEVVMTPIVLCELLSFSELPAKVKFFLKEFRRIPVQETAWVSAGEMRSELFKKGLKAKLADCLIAQTCMDSKVPFLTVDRDFRHFKKFGLDLI